MATQPKRGEVYWVDFDPSIGGEIRKKRPAIVISNDVANSLLNRVVVIPVTSNTERIYPAEALVDFGGRQSKAMADQITAASKLRVGARVGEVSAADMKKVELAVLVHLGIEN